MRLIAFALAAMASASAQTNSWDLAQPDAKVMMGLNLKVLRESAMGEAFRAQMRSQQAQMGPAGMALGFLDQIDRVFISSTGTATPRPARRTRTGLPG